jgi:hypothetical protein
VDKDFYAALLDGPVGQYVGGRVYQRGTLGHGTVPAKPVRPYVMYGQELSTGYSVVRRTSSARRHTYTVYVYDDPESLQRIKHIMPLVDDTVLGLLDQQLQDGGRCMDSEPGSWNRDEYDTVTGLAVKNMTCYFTTSSN